MAKQLLFSVTPKDCKLDTFTVHGPGGGGKDTSNTGVRWTHLASGAVGEAREERSQQQNKLKAWQRMAESKQFRAWVSMQAAKIAGMPSVDEQVDKMMEPKNLKIEGRGEDGRWQTIDSQTSI